MSSRKETNLSKAREDANRKIEQLRSNILQLENKKKSIDLQIVANQAKIQRIQSFLANLGIKKKNT